MRSEKLNFLFSPLSNLSGIGEKTLQNYTRLLTKRKTSTHDQIKMLDLLFHLPEKILYRKSVKNIAEIASFNRYQTPIRDITYCCKILIYRNLESGKEKLPC